MKQEDLKNKMDQIGQDFDQELLWDKIQQQKEKKRRGIVFWLYQIGGILIIASSLFFVADIKTNNIDQNNAHDKNEYQANTIEFNEANKNKHDLATKTSANYRHDRTIETSASEKIEVQSNFKERNTSIKNEQPQNQNLTIEFNSFKEQEKVLNDTKYTNTSNSKLNISAVQEVLATQNSNTNTNQVNMVFDAKPVKPISEKEKSKAYDRSLSEVSEISLMPLQALNDPSDKRIINSKITPIKRKIDNNIIVGLYAGLGYDFHEFKGGLLGEIRNKNEKPLETISLGAFGRKHLNRNLFLELDLRWTRGYTKLERSERTSTYSLNDSADHLVEDWLERDYTYYNQYYRFDVAFGLGYMFEISNNWYLAPAISFGYNITSYQKGDYWDQLFTMTSLEDATEYRPSSSMFFGGQLKIIKKLNSNYLLGLDLEMQKRNSLTKSNYYRHNATPLLMKISLAKQF